MMTIHKLVDGYTYLTRNIAGGDVQRQRGQGAADYYTAKGNPPGMWLGRGAHLLDLDGQQVNEEQMKALFGLGQHPNAEAIIAAYLSEHVHGTLTDAQLKAVQEAALKAASLGRRFPQYKPLDPFEERVAERLARIAQETDRAPTSAEIKKVQREESVRQRAAVSGFDVVFAPVKSAAILWAVDERAEVRLAVCQAHEAARDAALEMLEEHAAFTRSGDVGQAQIATRGLIAAAFDHYDSRAGDPNLHTHVAISSKVLGADGKWKSLDARPLYALTVAASEFYNTRFETELTARIGVTFTARPDTAGGKEPVREITGVPTEFIAHYSARRTEIEARYDQLVREYRREHGYDPSRSAAHKLARQANLDTREGKKAARSLEEMRADWRQSLTEAYGGEAVGKVMAAARSTPSAIEAGPADVEALAARAIANLGESRSTWGMWNVRAEAERLARTEHSTSRTDEHQVLVEAVTATALGAGHSVRITAPALLDEPADLRRADGVSVFVQHASDRYTSDAVLEAEARLVQAATTPTAAGLAGLRVAAALDGFEARSAPLDPGQRALVTAFATDPRMLVVGLGPAGSGKTTAMRAYTHIAAEAGVRVIPLATSAASAAVLGKDLGTKAENLHKFLWEYTQGPNAKQLREGADVPFHRAGYALHPGDVVLVDEAGMAGTMNLDRLVTLAAARSATVRLLGDHRQLSAVESGGALRLIATEAGAVELTHLHRFHNKDEAAATLKLRVGDSAGLDFYINERRVQGGSRQAMVEAAYAGWKTDMLAGKKTLITAAHGVDVTALSAQARADRVAAGQVEDDGVQLRDGNRASRHDWIITRENDRRLSTGRGRDFVKNGDAWEVLKRYEDGSLKVKRMGEKGRITLPAEYVAAHIELLYASTVTRTQGSTVDTAHPLITPEMTRENLYVALTRAQQATTLYVATHELLPFDTDGQLDQSKNDPMAFAAREVLERILGREGAERSATETVRDLQEQAASLATVVPNYRYATETFTADRYSALLTQALGAPLAEQIISDAAYSAVARALRVGEAAHWQAEWLLTAACSRGDIAAADSPAQLLAWRINDITDHHVAPAHLHQPTAEDAARYATLIAAATGISAAQLDPADALSTPAALTADRTQATHQVSSTDLNRYAQHVADTLDIDTATVTAHLAWPQLALTLAAADRHHLEPAALLAAAVPHGAADENRDALRHLSGAARHIAELHDVRTEDLQLPATLRHAHTALAALGAEQAERALHESAWPALTAALRRAETGGHDPIALLRAVSEARETTTVESISQVLAWRMNRYLTTDPGPVPAAGSTERDQDAWRSLAWMLKAAENTGQPAETVLATATADSVRALAAQIQGEQITLRHEPAFAGASLPPWVTAPAQTADGNPVHRAYLTAAADLIGERACALAERAITDRPAWTRTLGDAPQDPAVRADWQRQIGVIAAYRDQYKVTDNDPGHPAGPYIEPGRSGHDAYWHAAAAALRATNIAASGQIATSPSTDRAATHQVAADLYRALPEGDRAQVLRAVAERAGVRWLGAPGTLDDAALTKPALAEPLAQALTEHGHLKAERDEHKAEQDQIEKSQEQTPDLVKRRRAARAAERQAYRDGTLKSLPTPARQQLPAVRHAEDQPVRAPQQPTAPRPETARPQPTPKLIPPPQAPEQRPGPQPRW
jgi:conjugative relaxase-like TrwC/TraI family protein